MIFFFFLSLGSFWSSLSAIQPVEIQALSSSLLPRYEAKKALLTVWSQETITTMQEKIESTRTHHRHYFPSWLWKAALLQHRLLFLKRWITAQFSYNLPSSKTISFFLVTPFEISSFFSHLDQAIRREEFDVIDLKSEGFNSRSMTIALHTPFYKDLPIGISFRASFLEKEVMEIYEAPFIRFIFNKEGHLKTLFPVKASISILLTSEKGDSYLQKIVSMEKVELLK